MMGVCRSLCGQKSEYTKNGGDVEEFGGFGSVFREYLDAVGMEKGRQYITLAVRNRCALTPFCSGKRKISTIISSSFLIPTLTTQ